MVKSLMPRGYFTCSQVPHWKIINSPWHCIYVFCIVLRKTCYYFPIQHRLIGVITEMEYVYSVVGNESLNTILPNQVLNGSIGIWKYVNWLFWFFLPCTNFNAQFLYSLTICMLHYNPRHVSSINMPIFRRTNCIITASGIVTLCKRLYSMPDESRWIKELCIKVGKWNKSNVNCLLMKFSLSGQPGAWSGPWGLSPYSF